jgi:hypothetical protein
MFSFPSNVTRALPKPRALARSGRETDEKIFKKKAAGPVGEPAASEVVKGG